MSHGKGPEMKGSSESSCGADTQCNAPGVCETREAVGAPGTSYL